MSLVIDVRYSLSRIWNSARHSQLHFRSGIVRILHANLQVHRHEPPGKPVLDIQLRFLPMCTAFKVTALAYVW